MFYEYFFISISNILKKRTRTVLMILGIFIGVCSVTIILSIGDAGKSEIKKQLDKFGLSGINIQASSLSEKPAPLSEKELSFLMKTEGVEKAMPLVVEYGSANISNIKDSTEPCLIWGIDENADEVIALTSVAGKQFTPSDVKGMAQVCLVDESYAKKVYNRVNVAGKYISLNIKGKKHTLKIVGTVKSQSDVLKSVAGDIAPTFIYLPYTTLLTIKQKKNFDQIAVKLKDGFDLNSTGEKISGNLSRIGNIKDGYSFVNISSQKNKIEYLSKLFTLILTAVAAISLFVGGLSIMNVMLVSVNERVYEIGIKKAVGASKANIMYEFLLESVIITLIGGLSGAAAGLLISYTGAAVIGFPYQPKIWIFASAIGFAVAIGVIFGVYPAKLAADMDPIEALHHE